MTEVVENKIRRNSANESIFSLFRTANTKDKFWLTIGLIGAIITGFSLPYFAFVFGRILNNTNNEKFYHRIPKLCEQLAGLTVVCIFAGIAQVFSPKEIMYYVESDPI